MSSNPLGTRTLVLKIDGEDVTADINKATITSGAMTSDYKSFVTARQGGGREYALEFTATQDPVDPNSIWNQIWEHAEEEIDIELLPYGGSTVSETNPAFVGTVVITEPDGVLLGGEANESRTARFTIDVKWIFTEKPTKLDFLSS